MKKIFNLMLLAMFFILAAFSLSSAEEQITLTTYYPSPYGSYHELRADQMAIGSAYRYSSLYDGLLIVSGSVGVGTPSPSLGRLEVQNPGGNAVYGEGANGVYGVSYEYDWAAGVFGENKNTGGGSDGIGVVGLGGRGVQGVGGFTGVVGCNSVEQGTYCTGADGAGVFGDGEQYGVYGHNKKNGKGVYGLSDEGEGVHGEGKTYAVYGESKDGEGVHGIGKTYAVYGTSDDGEGVHGIGKTYGVYGTSDDGEGVHGEGKSYGVYGTSDEGDGVHGEGDNGVYGSGTTWGGYFDADVFASHAYFTSGGQGQDGTITYVKSVSCSLGGNPLNPSVDCDVPKGHIYVSGGIIIGWD